jgi:hypothetical protein
MKKILSIFSVFLLLAAFCATKTVAEQPEISLEITIKESGILAEKPSLKFPQDILENNCTGTTPTVKRTLSFKNESAKDQTISWKNWGLFLALKPDVNTITIPKGENKTLDVYFNVPTYKKFEEEVNRKSSHIKERRIDFTMSPGVSDKTQFSLFIKLNVIKAEKLFSKVLDTNSEFTPHSTTKKVKFGEVMEGEVSSQKIILKNTNKTCITVFIQDENNFSGSIFRPKQGNSNFKLEPNEKKVIEIEYNGEIPTDLSKRQPTIIYKDDLGNEYKFILEIENIIPKTEGKIEIVREYIALEDVPSGSSSIEDLSVKYIGEGVVSVVFETEGEGCKAFSVLTPMPLDINGGETKIVKVKFAPEIIGKHDRCKIKYKSAVDDGEIPLFGKCVKPNLISELKVWWDDPIKQMVLILIILTFCLALCIIVWLMWIIWRNRKITTGNKNEIQKNDIEAQLEQPDAGQAAQEEESQVETAQNHSTKTQGDLNNTKQEASNPDNLAEEKQSKLEVPDKDNTDLVQELLKQESLKEELDQEKEIIAARPEDVQNDLDANKADALAERKIVELEQSKEKIVELKKSLEQEERAKEEVEKEKKAIDEKLKNAQKELNEKQQKLSEANASAKEMQSTLDHSEKEISRLYELLKEAKREKQKMEEDKETIFAQFKQERDDLKKVHESADEKQLHLDQSRKEITEAERALNQEKFEKQQKEVQLGSMQKELTRVQDDFEKKQQELDKAEALAKERLSELEQSEKKIAETQESLQREQREKDNLKQDQEIQLKEIQDNLIKAQDNLEKKQQELSELEALAKESLSDLEQSKKEIAEIQEVLQQEKLDKDKLKQDQETQLKEIQDEFKNKQQELIEAKSLAEEKQAELDKTSHHIAELQKSLELEVVEKEKLAEELNVITKSINKLDYMRSFQELLLNMERSMKTLEQEMSPSFPLKIIVRDILYGSAGNAGVVNSVKLLGKPGSFGELMQLFGLKREFELTEITPEIFYKKYIETRFIPVLNDFMRLYLYQFIDFDGLKMLDDYKEYNINVGILNIIHASFKDTLSRIDIKISDNIRLFRHALNDEIHDPKSTPSYLMKFDKYNNKRREKLQDGIVYDIYTIGIRSETLNINKKTQVIYK